MVLDWYVKCKVHFNVLHFCSSSLPFILRCKKAYTSMSGYYFLTGELLAGETLLQLIVKPPTDCWLASHCMCQYKIFSPLLDYII